VPLRFWRIKKNFRPVAVPGLVTRVVQEELDIVSVEELASMEDAVHEPSWQVPMLEELRSIEENSTCEAVDLPAGHRPIGLKWVYKAKKGEKGCIIKAQSTARCKRVHAKIGD
jgi:hypothetical protein